MGRLQDLYISRMVDYLASEGAKIADKALASKGTKNRSENQADAFGYAVYFNREIKKKGYARAAPQSKGPHKGWDVIGVSEGTGREWLDEFFATWEPDGRGFVLIVVNAAFYSAILEQGRGSVTRKFRIISQIWGDMEEIQKKFKGSVIALKNANP